MLTIDTHDDIPGNFATAEVDPGVRGTRQVDLPKMREGLLDVGFFIVFVGQTERTPENYQAAFDAAMQKFDAIHRMAEEMYPDEIEIAYTADDVERIHAEGKLVAAIGIENGYPIGLTWPISRSSMSSGVGTSLSRIRATTTSPTPRRRICAWKTIRWESTTA